MAILREHPVVAVIGPPSCPDTILRVMADLELLGNVVLGPHVWIGALDAENPIREYDPIRRWSSLVSKGQGAMETLLTNLTKQRMHLASKVVVVDIEEARWKGFVPLIKYAFAENIPVEIWEYTTISIGDDGVPIRKKLRTSNPKTLPEVYFE